MLIKTVSYTPLRLFDRIHKGYEGKKHFSRELGKPTKNA